MSWIYCKKCNEGMDPPAPREVLLNRYICPHCGCPDNDPCMTEGEAVIALLDTLTPPPPPTLRDQFAMAALQGLCANEQCKPLGMNFEPDAMSRRAYRLADAMIEARK